MGCFSWKKWKYSHAILHHFVKEIKKKSSVFTYQNNCQIIWQLLANFYYYSTTIENQTVLVKIEQCVVQTFRNIKITHFVWPPPAAVARYLVMTEAQTDMGNNYNIESLRVCIRRTDTQTDRCIERTDTQTDRQTDGQMILGN